MMPPWVFRVRMRPLRRILRPLMLLLTLLPASPPHAQTLPSGQAFQGPPAAPESDLALDVVRATTLFERNNRALSVARRAIDVAATEIRRADTYDVTTIDDAANGREVYIVIANPLPTPDDTQDAAAVRKPPV